MTLRVPTAKVANVGMRKLSEPALIKLALETLRGSKQFQSSEWSSRAQEYESKINSGDIVSIAEVVRDLYRLESQPEQSYSERQLFEAALDRLSREIAIVQHMTEAEAIGEIAAYLAGETPTSKQRAGVSPSSLPEREASLPGEMIRLDRLPVGEDGLPQWNVEIADATREFGVEFLAPFMVEVSPGQCFGGYVSRANWQTPVRTYEAKAVLIGRQNDEFRTTVVVSAPGVPRKQGSDPWMPYDFQYETSLPKVHVRDIVNTMRERAYCSSLMTRW
jgi:RNA polymerase-interacting CarD/CdnL/TRCF family regulator